MSLYEVKGVGLVAFVLCVSCGGEATNHGGAGGRGGTGAGGTTVGGGVSCDDARPQSVWASWPMPNPASSGLAQLARYDVDQAGVVLDEVTGLMWQRELPAPETQYAFDDAVAYCSESETGGYCDWRLPTRIELVSLVDLTLVL